LVKTAQKDKTQAQRFRETARALECDEDETKFDETLRHVARHKHPKDGMAAPTEGVVEKPRSKIRKGT